MTSRNLRHLRLFLAVVDLRSLTRASEICHVTQPAVTQAIAKIEQDAGGALFHRRTQGFFVTARGAALALRVRRAFALLDPALIDISPRLVLTVSATQLRAVMAVQEAENFTLAARRLGVAQPTVHRAVAQVEQEAGRNLFERTTYGVQPSRACLALVQSSRLAFYELDQADADMAEFDGRAGGSVVVGAMPLARSVILPRALVAFRKQRPVVPVQVLDGPYNDLLVGLRRGDIDFLIGALRDPPPMDDVQQVPLFEDGLVFLAGNHHPLAKCHNLRLTDVLAYPWVVPRQGTPARSQFEELFGQAGLSLPTSVIDSGSILLMRGILDSSDHLACISRQQANAEIAKGLLVALDILVDGAKRSIGITHRRGWQPTTAQQCLLDLVRNPA